jgi:hypothetical protein
MKKILKKSFKFEVIKRLFKKKNIETKTRKNKTTSFAIEYYSFYILTI